jgi:putative hemolysin
MHLAVAATGAARHNVRHGGASVGMVMNLDAATCGFAPGYAGDAAGFPGPGAHIVDQLIAERGRSLVRHPAWPLLRGPLYAMLNYRDAVRMADDVARMSAQDAFQHVSDLLRLDVQVTGLERLPRSGGFVLVSNHPTGIPDGIAVFDMIKNVRQDVAFFANRDAIRVNANLADIIIPVEWRADAKSHAKSRETAIRTARAFREGRAVALFPSGRIAYWDGRRFRERPWQATGIQLARRFNVPLVPMNMQARNSWLFYALAQCSAELRDMTVFHELLNKKGQRFRMTIGQPIAPDRLDGNVKALTATLQRHCEWRLRSDPDAVFPAAAPSRLAA